jgi:hypothetical protein
MCAAPRLNAQIFGHIRPMPDSSGIFCGRVSRHESVPRSRHATAGSCQEGSKRPLRSLASTRWRRGHSAPSPDWQWPRATARYLPRYYRSRPSLFRHARCLRVPQFPESSRHLLARVPRSAVGVRGLRMFVVGTFFTWIDAWTAPYELVILTFIVVGLLSWTLRTSR